MIVSGLVDFDYSLITDNVVNYNLTINNKQQHNTNKTQAHALFVNVNPTIVA